MSISFFLKLFISLNVLLFPLLSLKVKIKLPDSKLSEIDLDVKRTFLDCRSPN